MEKAERDKLNQELERLHHAYDPGNGPYEPNAIDQEFDYVWIAWTDKNAERLNGSLEMLRASESDPQKVVHESERIRRYFRERHETISRSVEDARAGVFRANGLPDARIDVRSNEDQAYDRWRSEAISRQRVEFSTNPKPAQPTRSGPDGPSL